MRTGLLLAIVWVLTACPPSPGPLDAGGDAGAGPSPIELCERLAIARCGLNQRCYAAFARFEATTCVTQEQAKCLARVETLGSAFDGERVVIDADRLASCETRMKTSACPPSFPPDYPIDLARPMADCGLETGLVRGLVKNGATCVHAVECEAGTVCVKPGGVCRGTCAAWAKAGDACGFGCAPGLVCDKAGTCVLPGGHGQPCATSAECQADLICLGTCLPRRAAGEACSFDTARLSQCEPGLACDVVPWVDGLVGVCVLPRADGQQCRYHWSCQPGLVCADIDWSGFPNAVGGAGSCRAPDPEASNCPATQYALYLGDQCGPGLSCSAAARTCQRLPVQGEACTPSAQNCGGIGVTCKPTGSTDVGVCSGPVGTGERCAFEIDATHTVRVPCATGACDVQGSLTCRPPAKSVGAPCAEDGECLSNRCAVQQDRSLRCANPC